MELFERGGQFGVDIECGGEFEAVDLDGKSLGVGRLLNTKLFDTEKERSEWLAAQGGHDGLER